MAACLPHYPSLPLKVLREITANFGHESHSRSREVKWGSPKHKAVALVTEEM
jgi:hypothetical protein